MSDLIDRQKAINVIERMRAYIGHNMERAVGAAFIEILDDVGKDIGRLPSTQFATDTNVGTKLGTNLAEVGTEAISRQSVIDMLDETKRIARQNIDGAVLMTFERVFDSLVNITNTLPTIQPEIVRCKDCKYWHSGSCEYPEHVVNSQDYYVGDIETEAEHFCGYAKRREVTA